MKKKTLYGVTKNGDAKEWSVWTDGDTIYVEHGKVGGKLQVKTTVCSPKNIGRANETTASQQAESEAQSKWNKQYDKYYRESIEEAKSILDEGVMLAQDYTKKPHYLSDTFYASPKLDGCFSYNTQILTNKGNLKIGDIVDKNIDCSVLSFNKKSKSFEFKPVINRFNNGYKDNSQWLSFKSNGQVYGITKNHKCLNEDLKWCRADTTENLIGISENLTGILTGMLLGDSCAAFEKRGKEHHTRPMWRLTHSTCIKDSSYGEKKCELLENIITFTRRKFTSGYGYDQVSFTSSTCSDLPFDIGLLYNLDVNDRGYGKRVGDIDTTTLRKYFTDMSLLVWYLDDGNLHYNNGNKNTPRLIIDVSRYSDKTLKGFVKLFKLKYNVEPTIGVYSRGDKTEKRLTFKTNESLLLYWRMAKVGGGLLSRKFPEGLYLHDPDPCKSLFEKCDNIFKDTKSPFTIQGGATAYDIEVEGNHNYIANGYIVHNCRVKSVLKDNLVWKSRGNKEYPIPPQIITELKDIMEHFNLEQLDGEGYSHSLPLQHIQSCIKKHNHNTPRVVYCIFDVPMLSGSWEKRLGILQEIEGYIEQKGYKWVKVVPQELLHKDALDVYLKTQLDKGFEGAMMRNKDSGDYLFQNNRSNDLLKYKIMKDSEAKVIGCEEDKNGQGLFTMEWKSPYNKEIVNFELSMNGSQDENTYEKLSKRVGEFVTFKYQNYTEEGKPTFARGLCFRECALDGTPLE